MLKHLQQNSDATIDDILLVIQQREQTVQFVNKQNEPNETASFARNGQLRKRATGKGTISAGIHNKAKECGTMHERRNCQAFGKSCNNCEKPNHFAQMCRVKKQTNHFVEKEAKIEENNGSTSDYSYFIGHTDYIKNGKEIPMMEDTRASLTLISKKLWKQIGKSNLEEKNTGIETCDKQKMKNLDDTRELNVNLDVVDTDRKIELLRRDMINQIREPIDRCFEAEASKKLPTVKGAKASIELKPDAKTNVFRVAEKTVTT